jgi:hypothetical protein
VVYSSVAQVANGDNLKVSENELELGIGFALATNIGARILAFTVIERFDIGRVPR